MDNHFHLLLETPLGNLSEFMRWFNITYTSHYNRRYKRFGHLYQGRFKSILVEKESYLHVLSRYIHLNPVQTKQKEKISLTEKKKYLKNYKWSSLLGYVCNTKKNTFIDYSQILEEYGGENKRGMKTYWEAICDDLSTPIDVKERVIGGTILGSEKFINWAKEKFLKESTDKREVPSIRRLLKYNTKEKIIKAICKEFGKSFEEIKNEKGIIRHTAMEILYRLGGLKGVEIGKMMGVDYSTVSQGRKRLREKLKTDKNLSEVIERVEEKLSL
jgi:putative transposase